MAFDRDFGVVNRCLPAGVAGPENPAQQEQGRFLGLVDGLSDDRVMATVAADHGRLRRIPAVITMSNEQLYRDLLTASIECLKDQHTLEATLFTSSIKPYWRFAPARAPWDVVFGMNGMIGGRSASHHPATLVWSGFMLSSNEP